MSWGAVLYIQGPPEVRKQIDKEVSKRTGGEAGPTPESGTWGCGTATAHASAARLS